MDLSNFRRYLYNDSLWLAEQLKDVENEWNFKENLGPRAQGKVKFDKDIQGIKKFGRRGYSNEMSSQRTLLNDLLGAPQNLFQQGGRGGAEYESAVDSVIARIQQVASEWKPILSKSAWPQAIGSLLGTLASKIISDVEDLETIGADESYQIAQLIAKIAVLDNLFLFENEDGTLPEVPYTAQYAPNWLKLQFLSEFLQSDLKEVQWLWFKSDLSRYFDWEQITNLIKLSFEDSPRRRELLRKIQNDPLPDINDDGETDE